MRLFLVLAFRMVCPSLVLASPTKTDEPIEMPLEG